MKDRSQVAAAAWRSTVLAPSADRRLRTPGTLPALILFPLPRATKGWSRRHMPPRPMRRGFRTPRIARSEVAARSRLRSRSGAEFPSGRRASACSDGRSSAEASPVAARARHCPQSEISNVTHSMMTCAGLPLTPCWLWLAEAVWSEAGAAPAMCTGAGKRAQRFRAASSFPVIRNVLKSEWRIGARLADAAKRIPYSPRQRAQREYERRTFSGSRIRPRPDKAGTASAAAQPFDEGDACSRTVTRRQHRTAWFSAGSR